jgi:hypothetical protein
LGHPQTVDLDEVVADRNVDVGSRLRKVAIMDEVKELALELGLGDRDAAGE